jgi:hypothetical protein
MAIAMRDRISEKAAPYLQPGEVIQDAFAGQAASPFWSLLSYWIVIIKNAYRAVVVTDRRIIVFQSSRWGYSNIKSVKRELPRATRLGPPQGTVWYKTEVLGELLYIHRRFFKDIEAADAKLG